MGYVKSVAWSPSGEKLASGSDDKTVVVWDAASGAKVAQLEGHAGKVEGVAWSPDGSRLASCGEDQSVVTWDVESGTRVSAMTGHVAPVTAVAWNPAGDRIASASDDRSVAVWEAGSGSGAGSDTAVLVQGRPAAGGEQHRRGPTRTQDGAEDDMASSPLRGVGVRCCRMC